MSGHTLQISFHARCTPTLAVQRVSTILNHQRAPLIDLRVWKEPGNVGAWLHLDTLDHHTLAQILQRLARDWSVATVRTLEATGDDRFTKPCRPASP